MKHICPNKEHPQIKIKKIKKIICSIFKKKKKKKRVSAGNWISEQNKSFDFFANFWETRGLKRSKVRRREFCKTRFSRCCCCRTPLLLLLLLLLLGLALTNTSVNLFSFFHFTFWFSPHVNFLWKFKLRWDVRGLCLYLHSLPSHGHVTK